MVSRAMHEQENDDGTLTRFYEDGSVRVFDAQGKIVKTELSAQASANMREIASQRRAAESSTEVDNLLRELGLESSPSAKVLARNFAGGGSQSVAAARELFRLSNPKTDDAPLKVGEACPRCGRTWHLSDNIEPDMLRKLIAGLGDLKAELRGEVSITGAPEAENP